jgi:uncharacterized integral membrane protein (TIGR00698 family)
LARAQLTDADASRGAGGSYSDRVRPDHTVKGILPGIFATALVAVVAVAIGALETWAGTALVVEPLVIALLLGIVAREVSVRIQSGAMDRLTPGVKLASKEVLEVAVVLMGATMDVPRLFTSGPGLAFGIVAVVLAALALGIMIGRAIGLPRKLATLIAAGNAICGNSAIVAVASAMGAEREDVAASIALTAVIGVVMVITLPLLVHPLNLSEYQYGVLTGLTVYAVPQVLAAAFAVSAQSAQVATAVKLGRVLMLGPIVTFFAIRERAGAAETTAKFTVMALLRTVPWFVAGFLVLAALRSLHLIGPNLANRASDVARVLTIGAMAGLGLSTELGAVRRVGRPAVIAVAASLAVLFALALGVVHAMGG